MPHDAVQVARELARMLGARPRFEVIGMLDRQATCASLRALLGESSQPSFDLPGHVLLYLAGRGLSEPSVSGA
jgi:hypothetical protein